MDHLVRTYLWQSKVHWPEREQALITVLELLEDKTESRRIVDIGCGPGLLLPGIDKFNFKYLGIDASDSIIRYCESLEKKNDVTFLQSDLSNEKDVRFVNTDIVILNGVAHHLDELQFRDLILKINKVEDVILLDHYRPFDRLSLKNFIPYILQSLDKGKFVRDYEFFQNLPGFMIKSRNLFPIKFLGIRLWDYFCHHYQKTNVAQK